jgi:hypothetical protein
MYIKFLVWNKFPRYTELSEKRKFNTVHVMRSIFKIQKEGNTCLNVSGRIYKKLVPPLPLRRRTVAFIFHCMPICSI